MTGIFPDSLKNAVITPIHKKGQKKLPSNCQPISVLQFLSKIFAKFISKKLSLFIYQKEIISNIHFGVVKDSSTVNAVIVLTDYTYESLNSKIHVKNVSRFLEGLYTINHLIVLSMLEIYGIGGLPLQLISNHLQNRHT